MRRFAHPCVLGLIAVTASARASAASPADVSAADALFREARTAARRGDHATACPKFRASYQLDPAVGTLLNVADCEEHDGHLVNARKRFEEALPRLGANDDRIPYVRSRLLALSERMPRIVGRIGARVQVKIDGEVATSTSSGIAHAVDPGKHEVRVIGPGRDETATFVVREGERREIDFAHALTPPPTAPAPIARPAPPPPEPPEPPEPRARAAGFVVGGLGIGALAVSGVAIGLMFDAKSTADAHCRGSECDPAGVDATETGKTWGTVGAVTFGVGALGLGLGTYFFFKRREATSVDPTTTKTNTERKRLSGFLDELEVSPIVFPSSSGLLLRGTL